MDKARFYITIRSGINLKAMKMMGWRIDDIAGLAVSISYIISQKGIAQRSKVEELLRSKLPGWKVTLNLNRYIRAGYITEDDNKQLYLDWRTRAEIDEKSLVELLLSTELLQEYNPIEEHSDELIETANGIDTI